MTVRARRWLAAFPLAQAVEAPPRHHWTAVAGAELFAALRAPGGGP